MRKINVIYLFFILLIPVIAIAQKDEEEFIKWSAERKLTWNDFKGEPQTGTDVAALTSTYLGIEYHFENKKVNYQISCRFSRNRSWVAHKSDYILRHEQGHFDITELFARKLNKAVSELIKENQTKQKELASVYEKLMKEKSAMQEKYDTETDNSRNTVKQEEWLKKINEWLNDYQEYAEY
jgi:predicted secreted Zn-dependent protease